MTKQIEVPLVRVNSYRIQKKNKDGSLSIVLPKQYREDNKLIKGDFVVVYRNPLNVAELVIRVEKA